MPVTKDIAEREMEKSRGLVGADINLEDALAATGFKEVGAVYETPLLNTREKTHGNYTDGARIAQRIKRILIEEYVARSKRGQSSLSFRQQESLDLIATKIGRIIAGESSNPEHWDDIAGYAKLVSEASE